MKTHAFSMAPIITFFTFCFYLLVCSCNETPPQPDNPEAEITELWDDFTKNWNQMNATGLVELFAEDAKNIPPEFEVYTGREQIKSFFDMMFDNHISSYYKHEINELSYTATTAVEYGNFEVDWVRKDSIPWQFKARSIASWEKNALGKWEIKYFIFNTL